MRDKTIRTIKQALKFCEKMDYDINEVKIKYKMKFDDDEDIFEFADDKSLIEWCEEDRQRVEESKGG